MKIINSHYIPLPEPHSLIVSPLGYIYEQLGTLSVVEETPGEKGEYGITTHNHPVVSNAEIDIAEDDGKNFNLYYTLAPANGQVLDDFELSDCKILCFTKHRVVNILRFNTLAFTFLTSPNFEDFYLDDFIDSMKRCAVKFAFPDKELQEITLTSYDNEEAEERVHFIVSDLTELFFAVPCWAWLDKEGVHMDLDKILMEFVNQARAYMRISPRYRFHFNTSQELIKPVVEKLNNELNDYLERKEEL
jgi:hypothetical protein